jgi:hypothetical protein
MNPTKTARSINRYESGLLSASEVANSLLYDLLSEPELDTAFLSSIGLLPDEVKRVFFGLLRRIQDAGFHWTPFLLTASSDPSDSAEQSAKLRQICALFTCGIADWVVPTVEGASSQVGPGASTTARSNRD